MVYINIVDDYTILCVCFFIFHIFYELNISLINICLLPNYNFGIALDSLNSKQEILHEHYIPAKYTYLYYLPC